MRRPALAIFREPGIRAALVSAVLFGAATPLAKLLLENIAPLALAGILYLGSAAGLFLWLGWRGVRGRSLQPLALGLARPDLPWLICAIASGGVVAPVLLLEGLTRTPASVASLLLNLEAVFTAVLAWMVFREHTDRRIVLGMGLLVAAGAVLGWSGPPETGFSWGPLAVAGACLCWGIDNNLTRRISGGNPIAIAAWKGLIAGSVNGLLAGLSTPLPAWDVAAAAAVLGTFSYGVSLVLFVVSLARLGSARTGAYFSASSLFGAALSLVLLDEAPGLLFWIGAGLTAAGLWLHASERHAHPHSHDSLAHTHHHAHEAHHQHPHDGSGDETGSHRHFHVHEPLTHSHPHYPDLHHRHRH